MEGDMLLNLAMVLLFLGWVAFRLSPYGGCIPFCRALRQDLGGGEPQRRRQPSLVAPLLPTNAQAAPAALERESSFRAALEAAGDEQEQLRRAMAASLAEVAPPGGAPGRESSFLEAMGAEEADQLRRALAASRHDEDAALRRQQEAELEESERVDREREQAQARAREAAAEAAAREAAEAERVARQLSAERKGQAAAREARQRLRQEALARLPGEPGSGEAGRVDVQVRLRDGRQLRRAFRGGHALQCVYDLVLSELGEDDLDTFQIVEAMPRKVHADRARTLADAGLRGRCSLLVETIDE